MLADKNNAIFQLAARFVNQTSKHIFLTGKAGTGKTTFLKFIRDNCFKKMAIVAPTGVAAINAGGVTLHSFFQLPFGAFLPAGQRLQDPDSRVNDQHTLINNIRFNADKRELLQELELLVIDEVSMVRADMLDAVDAILRYFRRQPWSPFGGIQVLYIGDLFQLPPVVPKEEWELLKIHYKSPFFFDAWALQQAPPLCLELKKIYRQNESEFIQILHNVRNNRMTPQDMHRLHDFYQPGFQPPASENYIILTSHNFQAEAINKDRLSKLPSRLKAFEAIITGEFSEKAYPAEDILHLKEGAQVMFIKNDKGETRRYYNGKIASIKRIDEERIWVCFPGKTDELLVEKETWKNLRYNYNREKDTIDEEELGTFSQYPLRLAWAITIHKSQGLTFEKAIVDAGASFAAGQVYVALSRLTSIKGLVLLSRIHPGCISTDQRVIAFTESRALEEEALENQLEKEQKNFICSSLVESFKWTRLVNTAEENFRSLDQRQIPDKQNAIRLARDWSSKIIQQEKTAIKFCRQLEDLLLTAEAAGYQELNQRMQAAAIFFSKSIEAELIVSLSLHIRDMKKKKKSKAYLKSLDELKTLCFRKKEQIEQAAQIVAGLFEGQDSTDLQALLQIQNKKFSVRLVKGESLLAKTDPSKEEK